MATQPNGALERTAAEAGSSRPTAADGGRSAPSR